MERWLIIGASRGIGLELARQLAEDADREVIGTVRAEADAGPLRGAGCRVELCDIAEEASVRGLASALAGSAVDVLVNNAGIFPDRGKGLEELDAESTVRAFRVNTVGPLLATRALLPNLESGERKLVINITSTMGSIGRASGSASNYAYRASKAALNMCTVLMAGELRPRGIACVATHPGWVRTDMGGEQAAISTDESVRTMLETWSRLSADDSGRVLDTDGTDLPH